MFHTKLHTLVLSTSLLAAAGCSVDIGVVRPQPVISAISGKVNKQITIVLGKEIMNNFTLEASDLKPVHVSEYRSSWENALRIALAAKFAQVAISTEVPSDGLALEIQSARPFLRKRGVYGAAYVSGISVPNYDVEFVTKYNAKLLNDGKLLNQTTDETASIESTAWVGNLPTVFSDGIKHSVEKMASQLFTAEVLNVVK